MRYFYHVLVYFLCSFLMLYSRRIEDVLEAVEDNLRRVDAPDAPVVEKCHALTAAHLVEIGRRGHDGDAALLQRQEHLPEFLAAYGVNARRRLVEEEYTRTVYQRTTQCQFLFHAA